MPDSTPNLALPYIVASQAQKELAHNDALNTLDALVQPTCMERRFEPPAEPANGDTYVIAGGTASGAWLGYETYIAAFYGQWHFVKPEAGWSFYDQAATVRIEFNGTGWVEAAAFDGQFANGTAAEPSITFADDPDSGIYRLGNDDLGIVTGGVLRFRIDPQGNLRAASGALLLGEDAAAVQADAAYLLLKDRNGVPRVSIGEAGGDQRILIDLHDTAGASSVLIRDSSGESLFVVGSDGSITMPSLPTTDPVAAGRLWNNGGALAVSAG